ncbi:MAG TPA: MerR family DNA-binding protein [Acetobacteraceae bacterium]|nr:MerR family DNA-binding protein [Acetobacteraceae bacterium]
MRRLAFVRRLGFTPDEVRALLGLAAGGQGACAEVRAKVASIRAMERILATPCAGEVPRCPLISVLAPAPARLVAVAGVSRANQSALLYVRCHCLTLLGFPDRRLRDSLCLHSLLGGPHGGGGSNHPV